MRQPPPLSAIPPALPQRWVDQAQLLVISDGNEDASFSSTSGMIRLGPDSPSQAVKIRSSGSQGAPGLCHLTYPLARPRYPRWAFHNDISQSPALPVAVEDPVRRISSLSLSSPQLAPMYMFRWVVKSNLRSHLCVFYRSRPQAQSLHKPPDDRRWAAPRQDTSRL
ncbi:hypothetical protein NDU88_004401 [Pleurodeles waltl]|uniref:Uncharacterized protein n=1 Tax=Pleurodeles waltl TaxID=8319 RepID=A0AAV7VGZ5_PLEWA|nr:hypothetical protein NDU88_004401 [Pleurodeles waltl]